MIIYLTKGFYTLVDNEDYSFLNQYKWYYKNGYAARHNPDKSPKHILMHKQILNQSNFIDHINGNKLDNRKSNLRVATKSQNAANSRKRKGSSKFKGVYWDKSKNKWKAAIGFKNKRITIGRFSSELEAAKAYNKAAIEYFGEFARLNNV